MIIDQESFYKFIQGKIVLPTSLSETLSIYKNEENGNLILDYDDEQFEILGDVKYEDGKFFLCLGKNGKPSYDEEVIVTKLEKPSEEELKEILENL